MIPPHQFELALRATCDRMFERESPPDNPVKKLVDGELSRAEAQQFFGGPEHWENVLIFNEVILSRLLELCPHVDARVQLWHAIWPEYGRGHLFRAHPYLNKVFMTALGVPEEQLGWELDRSKPSVQEKIAKIEAKSWIQLLTYFLGIETVGPKVFGIVADAVQRNYGLKKDELLFLTVHYVEDRADSEVVFPLVARYAVSEELQAEALAELEAFYNLPRYQRYCSAIGPMEYQYLREPSGVPRRADRRRFSREPLEIGVVFQVHDDDERHRAATSNISGGGLFLKCSREMKVGTRLKMTLIHPKDESELSMGGRVIHTKRTNDGTPLGFAVELDAQSYLAARLLKFISDAKSG